MDFSTVICWTNPFVILGVSGLFCRFCSIFIPFLMEIRVCKQCRNVDPDQTSNYVASDLGLHGLPMTLLQVSRRTETTDFIVP